MSAALTFLPVWLRRWFRAEPMLWSAREALIMRVLFALAVYFTGTLWDAPVLDELKRPNGLARLLPVQGVTNPDVIPWLRGLSAAGLLAYAAGLAPALTLFPPLLILSLLGSVRNSAGGDITHHTQIVGMVLFAQWAVYAVAAVRGFLARPAAAIHSRAVWWSVLLIAAAYTASGMVKMKRSHGAWIARAPLFAVQMTKATESEYYSDPENNVVPDWKRIDAPRYIAAHPWQARLFFGTGLVLELFAFIMMLSRTHARWWALALIGMHIGISVLMEIEFWNHMLLLTIFAVNLPGLIPAIRRPAGASAAD